MADVFVTLVSIQPAVSVATGSRPATIQGPQSTDMEQAGGLYDVRRQNQVTPAKINPPGAK
jgi:hypothetical protein